MKAEYELLRYPSIRRDVFWRAIRNGQIRVALAVLVLPRGWAIGHREYL